MNTQEDPATPAFWDVRFRDKRMPWDAAGTPPDLERYLAQESGGRRVLEYTAWTTPNPVLVYVGVMQNHPSGGNS